MPVTLHVNVSMKSSTAADGLTIGELAAHFGLGTHVLRHWESAGLLSPRRVNGRRRYDPDSRTRVAIILHGKQLGLSLAQLHAVLAAQDMAGRRALLQAHRAELERRIAQAQAAERILDHAVDCPADDFLTCPELQRLVHQLPGPPYGGRPRHS